MRGRVLALVLALMLSASTSITAISNSHGADPQGTPCGTYNVKKDEVIAGVKFPKGNYQIYSYNIACNKVIGSKGFFTKFLKQKDKDPLPKPWKYLSNALEAGGFTSGPGVGFRVQIVPTTNAAPAPSASATPTPTPTPTVTTVPLTLYERFRATGSNSLKMYEEWRSNAATGKPESKIEYWFGTSVPNDIVVESRRRLDNAVLQWERFHKVSRSKIYMNLSMKDQISENCQVLAPRSTSFTLDWCKSQAEGQLRDFIYQASAWESEGNWRPILAPRLSPSASVTHIYVLLEPIIFYTDSFFPRIEHEWFHQIQFDLSGNNLIRENPVWFMEGSAEYFGLLVASMDDPEYFIRHRSKFWFPGPEDNRIGKIMTKGDFSTWISKNTVPRLSYNDWSDNSPSDGTPYKFGAVLTEWLVGKIGFKGVVNLMKDIEDFGWKKAFERQLGKPQELFLDEMADYLYFEYQIARSNVSWLDLPPCKSLQANRWVPDAKRGVCFS